MIVQCDGKRALLRRYSSIGGKKRGVGVTVGKREGYVSVDRERKHQARERFNVSMMVA